MRRQPLYWVGTALLALGGLILLAVAGLYVYGEYERIQFDRMLAEQTPVMVLAAEHTEVPEETPTPEPTETPVPTSTPEPTRTPLPTGTPEPTSVPPTVTPTPTATATSTATPVPTPRAAQRILIPKISLDAPVVESIIRNGEWVVPKFAAGHLQGTTHPGVPGNAVYAGHVSSISSGDVFANLGKLANGDKVTVRTKSGDLAYEVTRKHIVKNTDISVTKNAGDERITLITCTGTWLPLQRDYSHRLIIVATRVP